MKVDLTKLEIDAVVAAAGQMKDDMEQYYSFMPKRKLEKFIAAYETGMNKLVIAKNKRHI